MTFETDLETDREDVFLNTDEFAETITYRIASTGVSASFIALIEDEGDTILSDGIRAHIGADDVAIPVKGDQITRSGGATYTVQFVGDEDAMHVLDCEREEEIT